MTLDFILDIGITEILKTVLVTPIPVAISSSFELILFIKKLFTFTAAIINLLK